VVRAGEGWDRRWALESFEMGWDLQFVVLGFCHGH